MLSAPVTQTIRPPQPLDQNMARHWLLDPSIDFLNHGSFGATPRVVLESQTRWRGRIEARPVEMIARKAGEFLDQARGVIGAFLGAAPANFGFTSNATAGVNAVLRSLPLKPGDELLTTNHVYRAVRKTMLHACNAAGGAVLREVDVPLPVRSDEDVVKAVTAGITPRTKVLVLCHITSATGIRFPAEKIVKHCAGRGVDVLIDGAHAAGTVDLNIEAIGAAYYSGNLHKWMCAPKGSAFLWVRPDRQSAIHPNTISHFYGEGFETEFNWQGTRDLSAWICAAEAVEFMAGLGWDRVRKHNHELATWVQTMLTQRWGTQALSPLDGSMLGAMASVALPEGVKRFGAMEKLQALLFDEHHFEVPVIDFGGRWLVRPCCQVYNTADQYERLGDVIAELA